MLLIAGKVIRLQSGRLYPGHEGLHADGWVGEGDPDVHFPFLGAWNIEEDLVVRYLGLQGRCQFRCQVLFDAAAALGVPEEGVETGEEATGWAADFQNAFIKTA